MSTDKEFSNQITNDLINLNSTNTTCNNKQDVITVKSISNIPKFRKLTSVEKFF